MNYQIEAGEEPALLIFAEGALREELKAAREETPSVYYSDVFLWDVLEPVWTNGLCCSIRPEDVGALTDAPMLCEGINDDGKPQGRFWAYMNYQVRSPLDDLADEGVCRWQYGGEVT